MTAIPGFRIELEQLGFSIRDTEILAALDLVFEPGSFVAVLGENGAGKTTLLDLMMGFRPPTTGVIRVDGEQPHTDPWKKRSRIAYLSEKVDLPGDWSALEFLRFNEHFYDAYSSERELELARALRVSVNGRLGNMSAGEIRRVQIVAALAAQPRLVIVDEITAVLDIVGRRKFMQILSDYGRDSGCTIIMATNILEDLVNHISHVLLMEHGRERVHQPLDAFLDGAAPSTFSQKVADLLEDEAAA